MCAMHVGGQISKEHKMRRTRFSRAPMIETMRLLRLGLTEIAAFRSDGCTCLALQAE